MRDRISVEWDFLKLQLSELTPRLKQFEENQEKLKRVKFLLDARKNIREIGSSAAKVITLEDIKKRIEKLFKRKQRIEQHSVSSNSSSDDPTQLDKMKEQHVRDILAVKRKSVEFKMIDRLTYMHYICKL